LIRPPVNRLTSFAKLGTNDITLELLNSLSKYDKGHANLVISSNFLRYVAQGRCRDREIYLGTPLVIVFIELGKANSFQQTSFLLHLTPPALYVVK
jgi:hypothetical protein